MSLTSGRGPLSGAPAGRFTPPIPEGVVYVEPFPRRVRGVLDGRTVLDTDEVLLVHRPGHPPTYAVPAAALDRAAGLDRAAAADRAAGVTGLPVPEAPGFVHVPWDAMDAWFEEEEQVFGHPRNPYHRIDCVRTRRRLRVSVGGGMVGDTAVGTTVLVDTDDTLGIYETALAPKLYVARDLVRMDLLAPSGTTTYCPYKGTATYWSAVLDGVVVPDVAWSYDDPLAEFLPAARLLSFEVERVRVVTDLPAS